MGYKRDKLRDFAYELVMDGMVSVPKLLFKYYAKLGIEVQELVFVLQLIVTRQVANDGRAELDQVADNMQITVPEVKLILAGLLEKQLIKIVEGPSSEQYSLSPIFEGLAALWLMDKDSKPAVAEERPITTGKVEIKTVCRAFEEDFGRLLNPLEVETIRNWLIKRQISPSILAEALKIATLRGIKNLQYIEKLLLDWEERGLHDIGAVRSYIDNRNPVGKKPHKETVTKERREPDMFKIWYSG